MNGFTNAGDSLAALLILLIGWLIARAAKWGVASLINKTPLVRHANQPGVPSKHPSTLGRTVGSIVFALIIIPVAIAALDTLNIDAISRPATAMLQTILVAIPQVIAAGIILALAYVLGKFASKLIAQFLETTGFDRTIGSLGLFSQAGTGPTSVAVSQTDPEGPSTSPLAQLSTTPSKAVGPPCSSRSSSLV